MFQHIELLTGERRFETVGKADEELILVASRGAGHHTDGTARMHEGIIRSPNFRQ